MHVSVVRSMVCVSVFCLAFSVSNCVVANSNVAVGFVSTPVYNVLLVIESLQARLSPTPLICCYDEMVVSVHVNTLCVVYWL